MDESDDDYLNSDESSIDDYESEDDGLDEIEPFPISNKGYDSFSSEDIFRKFKSLVDDIEQSRNKGGVLPKCDRISQSLLIECSFDVPAIKTILNLDRENRRTAIENKTGIIEPRKEYDQPEAPFECFICCVETEDQPVGTGFCDHFSCTDCLQTYLNTKLDETTIFCMSCKTIFTEELLSIYCQDRDHKAVKIKNTTQVQSCCYLNIKIG